MIKPRHSLSRRLGLGILLMAVIIFVLSLGIFFWQSRRIMHQQLSDRTNSTLNTTMKRVARYIGAVETAARSNVWLMEENFTPDSLQAIAYRIVMRNGSIISCSVGIEPNMFPEIGRYLSFYTVNDGDTIYTVREPDYEYFNKTWYKAPRSTNMGCWVNPFSDYTEAALDHNDAVASFCIPLHTANGRIAGVLATDFSFTSLASIISSTESIYPSAYYMLLGSDGRYLIHPETSLLFKKTIFSESDSEDDADLIALGHEMTAGMSGMMHLKIGGEYCHVSYRPVLGTDWSLAIVIKSDEMMEPYDHLAYVILVLIIIGLLFIVLLSYRVVRQTIKPIHQLIIETEKIADGHYDEVIPLSDRKDAVALLQNNFSAMQQSIITHMGRIELTAKEIGEYNVEQEEKLEQAEESIKRKNLFIANILSQIRRPLTVIQKCAKQLRDSSAVPQKELAVIAYKMEHNAANLKRMVLMLFDCSETRASDNSMYNRGDMVSCNEVAHESISFVEEQFLDVKIRLESEVSDDFRVKTNHLYLMRTLRELLYNAAKFSDGEHILVCVTQTTDTVRFTIQDVGPGLPDEPHSLIFEPFMKVDHLSEGFGLGLPLCKRHAVSLGGDLVYDADYKEGCRLILELPK